MSDPRTLEACVAHALGRTTYVVHWVARTVRAQWAALPVASRTRMLELVEAAVAGRRAGGKRDAANWVRLSSWGREHLDAPVIGVLEVEGGLMPSAVRAVLSGKADGQAEYVWEDLAATWPRMLTATRQVVLTDLSNHDDAHLAAYAALDHEATRRVARLLMQTGRTRQAGRLLELGEDGSSGRTGIEDG